MLQTNLITAEELLRDLGDSALQRTIALNAMSVVFHLKMTGVLVTRCANLHQSAVFLPNISNGVGELSAVDVLTLAEVLGVTVAFLVAPLVCFEQRSKRTQKYLLEQKRVDAGGAPISNEDALLAKRFTSVVQGLAKKETQPQVLFLGDTRHGQMWVAVLRKYRLVYQWFQQEYQITAVHESLIEQGELGVPVMVHQLLMLKVQERLGTGERVIIPRSFERLQKLAASQTAKKDLRDVTETPCKDWLLANRKAFDV